jgi:TRAP-type transport system small permease protein
MTSPPSRPEYPLATVAGSDRWVLAGRKVASRLAIIERMGATLMLVLILTTMAAQVVARYLFETPFSWSEELSRWAMIWMTFLSAAWVAEREEHIRVDLWGQRLTRSQLAWMDGLVHVVVVGVCTVLLVGGLPFVWYVHPVASPSLGIPKSFWYGAVTVGLALMAVHHGLHLLLVVRTSAMVSSTSSAQNASAARQVGVDGGDLERGLVEDEISRPGTSPARKELDP